MVSVGFGAVAIPLDVAFAAARSHLPLPAPVRHGFRSAEHSGDRKGFLGAHAAVTVGAASVIGAARQAQRVRRSAVVRRQGVQELPKYGGFLDRLLSGPRPSKREEARSAGEAAEANPERQSRANGSVVRRLLGQEPTLDEQLSEDLAALRRKGEEELQALEKELDARRIVVEEDRMDILRRQQMKVRECMERRAQAKKQRAKERFLQQRNAAWAASRPATPHAPWRLAVDHASGRWYYFNEETRATTWRRPALPPPALPRPPSPPAPWELVLHTATGRWYYHHRESGKTAWEPPIMKTSR